MRAFLWVGGLFVLVGLALLVFPRAMGAAFCRAGKAASRPGSTPVSRAVADGVYDESRAPRLMRAMGWVILAQGLVMVGLGLFYR